MHPAMCNGITNTAVHPTPQGRMSPWGKATPIPSLGQRAGCVVCTPGLPYPPLTGSGRGVQLRKDLQPSPGKR